jgi:hypothetical protein
MACGDAVCLMNQSPPYGGYEPQEDDLDLASHALLVLALLWVQLLLGGLHVGGFWHSPPPP